MVVTLLSQQKARRFTHFVSHCMGSCRDGQVADLASCAVLQSMPNKRVLIVAHENITNNYYPGNNRSCLVSNCLFRVGGAACLMSNRCSLAPSLCCRAEAPLPLLTACRAVMHRHAVRYNFWWPHVSRAA